MTLEPTDNKPSVHFMQRVCEALDVEPYELALKLKVPYGEIEGMWTGTRLQLASVDHDEAWQALARYVDKHTGMLLSIREELQRKLNIERRRRDAERLRVLNR